MSPYREGDTPPPRATRAVPLPFQGRIFGRTPIIILSALALGGCAQTFSAKAGEIDSADFGEANRQTYAAMIIDPDPQYDEPLPTSAEHAADAIERYRNDRVKQPETIRTTAGVSGSGS